MPLSIQDIYNLPDRKRRVVRFTHKRRGKYRKVERPKRTREELVAFLRERGIRSSRQVDKLRKDGDPTLSDFRMEFSRWGEAVALAFGRIERPDESPCNIDYVAKSVVQFGLWTLKKYLAARKLRPDLIPSYKLVRRQWGGFSRLALFAKRLSTLTILNEYLVLRRRLGRTPTLLECQQASILLDKAIELFGSKKKIDTFLDELGETHEGTRRSP